MLPITRVSAADSPDPEPVLPLDDTSTSRVEHAVWASYDHDLYMGAPVGLQLVGRRLQEEAVLALAGVLEHGLAA